MKQRFLFQILLVLAPILASSAFTISSDRTTASAWTGRNNRQLQRHASGPEFPSMKAQRVHPSDSNPFYGQRLPSYPSSSLLSAASDDEMSSSEEESESKGEIEAVEAAPPSWKRVLFFYKYNKDGSLKSNDDDGLTFKQKLAKAGLSVLLSYGFVSNMSYCVTVSLA